METSLSCFLYHSLLAVNASPNCVADIIKVSRTFNAAKDITGLLMFDGLRFCQYMEGPRDRLQDLMQRIAVDPRHEQFTLALEAQRIHARLFERWSMAYVTVDDAEPLEVLRLLDGPSALEHLRTLLPTLDMV